jgi:hypothetical protein
MGLQIKWPIAVIGQGNYVTTTVVCFGLTNSVTLPASFPSYYQSTNQQDHKYHVSSSRSLFRCREEPCPRWYVPY